VKGDRGLQRLGLGFGLSAKVEERAVACVGGADDGGSEEEGGDLHG